MTRQRSVVSFNLSPSPGDAESTDEEEESEKEEHFYLPTHVRSIEETFDAWQESFKRAESRMSMLSSAASSPYPNTPQIMEEEESLDTQSNSTVFSAKESDSAVTNHVRPASRMSFVSENSNSEKTLSAEIRSRVSSASSVSIALETASQTGLPHEDSNSNDEDDDKSEKSFGADEMTRSLSSVVNFITEHGQITRSSHPLENFGDEPVESDMPSREDTEENSSVTSEKESIVETESIARNERKADNVSITGSQPEQGVSASGLEKDELVLVREAIGMSKNVAENSSSISVESEQDVSFPGVGLSGEMLSPVGENCVNDIDEVITQASDEGKIPSIVETTCTDDEEEHDKETPMNGSSIDSNSEAKSINNEDSESVPIEEGNEELSEITENISSVGERFSPADVENSTMGGETEGQAGEPERSLKNEEKLSSLDEAGCLHCQSISKRKDAISMKTTDGILSHEDIVESKILDSSREISQVALEDQRSEQKSTKNESTVDEQTSIELDNNSELGVRGSVPAIPEGENGQENTDKDNLSEPQVSQKESEPQERQEGAEGSQNESDPQDSQDESEDKNKEEDEDDEGGYTTEASATTLQGIRGVFGRRPTRCSTAATSVGFDLEDESAFSEDGFDTEDKPYDLATKEGLDAFKEFLLETSGEKLLQFWLEAECGRYLDDEDERSRSVYSRLG